MNRDYKQLRGMFDGNDTFMTGGFQVVGLRKWNRKPPDWTRSDESIKKLLLKTFPNLEHNKTHRKRAARWARFIYLYYRLFFTLRQVSAEMSLTLSVTRDIRRAIKRVVEGKSTKNGPMGLRPAHRPRKNK